MNKLFELGDRYAEKSTWKDFALLKLCVGGIGVLIGLGVPEKHRKTAACAAAAAVAVTYVPLMAKVAVTAAEMVREAKETE